MSVIAMYSFVLGLLSLQQALFVFFELPEEDTIAIGEALSRIGRDVLQDLELVHDLAKREC
jgi:hypothetical protein